VKTIISEILSITLVATILVTVCSLVYRANQMTKRRKYKKFINPKNTETMLQDELVSQFQDYVDSKQEKSRREHPTNYHKDMLDKETKGIISRIPKHKENNPPPRGDEYSKFIASKYRSQHQQGE
jgi:hypothetical protein